MRLNSGCVSADWWSNTQLLATCSSTFKAASFADLGREDTFWTIFVCILFVESLQVFGTDVRQFHIWANIIKLFIEPLVFIWNLVDRMGVVAPRIQIDCLLSHVESMDLWTWAGVLWKLDWASSSSPNCTLLTRKSTMLRSSWYSTFSCIRKSSSAAHSSLYTPRCILLTRNASA